MPANVGKADVKGVELESNMLLGAGFSVDLAASWLDFEYTETELRAHQHSDQLHHAVHARDEGQPRPAVGDAGRG